MKYHVLIIGGGPIGAVLARALKDVTHLQVAVLDKAAPVLSSSNQGLRESNLNQQASQLELRALAISYTSKEILSALGVWPLLQETAMPIEHIHVSDQGQWGMTRLHAQDYQHQAFGYVCSLQKLHHVLLEQLQQQDNVDFISGAELQSLHYGEQCVTVNYLQRGELKTLSAELLVAADGSDSKCASLLNMATKQKNYEQWAVVANVNTSKMPPGYAYERFTPHGPLALLPISEHCYSLVWTMTESKAQQMLHAPKQAFLSQLQAEFGYRCGILKAVGKRQAFPLRLKQATKIVAKQAVLVGNASQTLHPIAGQGFNLGLRDVAVLAQRLAQARIQGLPLGSDTLLKDYAKQRERDRTAIIQMTDSLVDIFSNSFQPLVQLRNLGLATFDHSFLKNILSQRAMGKLSPAPVLALGKALP